MAMNVQRHRLIGFTIAALAALAVAIFAPPWLAGIERAVADYDAAAVAVLFWFWTAASAVPERTAVRAEAEDPGRNIVLAGILLSVVAGLGAAVAILGHGAHEPTATERLVSYVLAIVAVISGWTLIHTMFTFRYAHLYYFDDDDDNEADRGLNFPGTANPSDFDFAYFSFIIGMTYQVSDVQVLDRRVRRVVLFHGLISFAYATMILALAINIVAGLLR